MIFFNFIKKHWKVTAILFVILICTVVAVMYVKASTISISVSPTSLTFTDMNSRELTATANMTLDNGVTADGYVWTSANEDVATAGMTSSGAIISPKGAGKTTINVSYSLSDGKSDSKSVPVVVNLTANTSGISSILHTGETGVVTTNAATGKTVTWTSTNSNIVSVAPNDAYGHNATVTAGMGGKATITAVILEDGLSTSFDVTVGVTINEDNITVNQNEQKNIVINSTSPQDSFWWTDNPNVATVSDGVVTGVYAGTTTIYASCQDGVWLNGAGDSIEVNVPYEVISPNTTVLVGDQISFATTANPAEVSYQSSNNNVISYDSATGHFVANSTGTATITVSWGSHTDNVTINVIDGFTLSSSAVSLNIGKAATITASVSNTDSAVTWKVADESMASISVSDDGLSCTVTALATGTAGYTTLVATQEINGVIKTANCKVYVLNPVNSLILMYGGTKITDTISVAKNNSIYITAYLNFGESEVPANTKLNWVSSDNSIISLSPVTDGGQQQLCLVNAKNGGKATITVVSEDGLYIATADFYVTEGVTNITLDATDVTAQMALNKYQLTATVLPDAEGVDKSVIWASLNESVLKVDQNGLVTFVAPGETYVSATSAADTSKVAYCHFLITQQVNGVKMDYDKVTLNVGDEYRLSAVIAPANATNQKVTWSSSNEAVVKVDANGMLKAISSGSATIVVQTEDGGYIDMTNVTVLQPVTSIQLSNSEISVKKGTIFWLNATVLPDSADNKSVTWSSSDTSLATVDQTGKVTTLGVGTVTIACVSNDNGTVAYCVVEITDPVTGLTLNSYYQEIVAGTKFVIVPNVLPIDAVNKDVTFQSSDPSIASVDANGIVTAVKGGKCEIIVTTVESSLKATCTIVVKEFVSSVKINGAKEYLNKGNSLKLSATVGSETASNKAVYWSSNNTSIATVDQTGKVTGVNTGSVVITATAADGSGVSDSVVIRVIVPVTSIKLDHTKITIYVGDTYNIKATINPPNASVKNLTWTSDDETIAKVYSDGDIVGVSAGRTVVHVKSNDGNNIISDCTVIVKNPINASSIHINSSEITMLKGKTRTLSARIYPTNTTEGIRWESSDTSIVTVDKNGKIITVGAGQCEVVAYSSGGSVYDSCTIYSMAMSASSIRLEQYDKFNLYVDGAPSKVSWRSSNPRIASVTQSGEVTGRMPGECTITATVDGKTVTCFVKVMAVDPGKFINSNKK